MLLEHANNCSAVWLPISLREAVVFPELALIHSPGQLENPSPFLEREKQRGKQEGSGRAKSSNQIFQIRKMTS